MLTEKPDIKEKEGSASGLTETDISDINEKNLEKAIKKGLDAPYAKVLIRLLLAILLVTSLGMFVTGIMKYNEFQREKEVLLERRDELQDEIDELRYLIDCPVDYDYIVRVAKQKLGLHLPDEIVYYNDYNDSK
ncbi:MAG: septum formation initiator family protein [Clostridia bacterium]|nr:septum formation initiator family protein [Clostridia bacterium]